MNDEYKPLRSSAPAHRLLNPRFRYVNAASTDVRATFERIKKRMALAQAAFDPKVTPLPKRKP